MRIPFILSILACPFLFIGCGEDRKVTSGNKKEETRALHPQPGEEPLSPFGTGQNADLIRRLREVLDRSDCAADQSCPLVKVDFNPSFAESSEQLKGQAHPIMIIDSGMQITSLTLHASRVLGFYKWNGHELVKHRPKIEVPKPYYDYMQLLSSNVSVQKSSEVFQMSQELGNKIGFHLTESLQKYWAHGDPIFNTLAEENPTNTFILIQTEPTSACFDPSEQALRKEQKQQELFGTAIRRLAKENHVQIINLSSSWSVPEAKEICRNRSYTEEEFRRYSHTVRPFYEILGNIPGTLLIQAGPGFVDKKTLEEEPWQYELDCLDLPNRIRVNRAAIGSEAVIGRDGRSDLSVMLEEGLRDFAQCTDIYIAVNPIVVKDHPSQYKHTMDGLRYMHFGSFSSYLAPLAASYLNFRLKDSEDVSTIKQTIKAQGLPLIFNPVGNKQFMSQRLPLR